MKEYWYKRLYKSLPKENNIETLGALIKLGVEIFGEERFDTIIKDIEGNKWEKINILRINIIKEWV